MYKATIDGKEYTVDLMGNAGFVDGKKVVADIAELKKGLFHVIQDHQSYTVEIVDVNRENKTVELKINNVTYTVGIKTRYDELLEKIGMTQKQSVVGIDVKAPMPGLILKVMAEEGQTINKGDTLLTMEAMKMENIIKAVNSGTVKKVLIKTGDKVEKNQALIRME